MGNDRFSLFLNIPPHAEPSTIAPTSIVEATTEATITDAVTTEMSVPTTQTPG